MLADKEWKHWKRDEVKRHDHMANRYAAYNKPLVYPPYCLMNSENVKECSDDSAVVCGLEVETNMIGVEQRDICVAVSSHVLQRGS